MKVMESQRLSDLSDRTLKLIKALSRHDLVFRLVSETNSDKSLRDESPRVRGERIKQSNPGMGRRAINDRKMAARPLFIVSYIPTDSPGKEQTKAVKEGLKAFWGDRQYSFKSLTWAGITRVTSSEDRSKWVELPTYDLIYTALNKQKPNTCQMKIVVVFNQNHWNQSMLLSIRRKYSQVTFVRCVNSNSKIVITSSY